MSCELQAWWTALVFSKKKELPDRETMLREIDLFEETWGKHVSYIIAPSYGDSMANFIGCKPRATEFPDLANAVTLGPRLPQSYRLKGPFKLENAKERFIETLKIIAPEWLSNEPLVPLKDMLRALLPKVTKDYEPDLEWLLNKWDVAQ